MWKTAVNKSIREVRFVLKQGPAHHGVWWGNSNSFVDDHILPNLFLFFRNYVLNKLPEIRMLNQNTFFQISEIPDVMQSPSACYFVYGDGELEIFLRDTKMSNGCLRSFHHGTWSAFWRPNQWSISRGMLSFFQLSYLWCFLRHLQIFKQKIAFGATLERADEPLINNTFRELPFSVVEAHEHVQYFDDGF